MEFQVKTVLGQKEILAYQHIAAGSVQKVKMNLAHWSLIAVGLIGLAASGAGVARGGFAGAGIFGMAVSFLCFIWGANWYRYLVWKVTRKAPLGLEQEFLFGEEGMIARTQVEKVSHRYNAFYALAESKDYFVLFLNKEAGYILDKKGFSVGEPQDFAAGIQEKTGKKITIVKI